MWKTTALILTGACLLLAGAAVSLSALADEPNQKGKDGIAREIDLKGYKAERQRMEFTKPARITSAEELAKFIADKEWRDRITKQVDFAKEQLLFFAWAGSGLDTLSFKVEDTRTGPLVVFSYATGETDDLRSHFRLFAVAKNTTWRVEVQK